MAKLNPEQLSRFESQEDIDAVTSLSESDVQLIDDWLLSFSTDRFQKVAMVVSKALMKSDEQDLLTNIPDVFFGIRVEALVENRLLQGEGDLSNMRFSEVRLANGSFEKETIQVFKVHSVRFTYCAGRVFNAPLAKA